MNSLTNIEIIIQIVEPESLINIMIILSFGLHRK